MNRNVFIQPKKENFSRDAAVATDGNPDGDELCVKRDQSECPGERLRNFNACMVEKMIIIPGCMRLMRKSFRTRWAW